MLTYMCCLIGTEKKIDNSPKKIVCSCAIL
uniref:Uncharacterized protein n=1 Tax=Rhizophora mucronata TaxID=61149 RepID=A0A2P2KN21_RHIMU